MRRKAPYDLEKITINIRSGDAGFLAEHYPFGYSVAIRLLIQAHVEKIRATKAAKITLGDLDNFISDTAEILEST